MKHFIKKRVVAPAVSALLCVPIALGTLAGCGGGGGLTTKEDSAAISFVEMGEVANTDAYAANALDKEIDYLLSLDEERLLYNFRYNAGLPTGNTGPYGGWEDSLIAGHTMGHYLTALAQAYANGGTPDAKKKQLKSKFDYIVEELDACQGESGVDGNKRNAQAGFLWGADATGHANDVEFQFNNVEQGHANIETQAWVPWYTMHKIIAGLIDGYKLTGSEEALTVAKGLGDWTYERVTKWSEATRRTVLSIEYGGMNDCLYNLYAVTGDEKYAVAAHQFDEDIPTQGTFSDKSMITRILDEDPNYLQNQHANTTIPKIIGLLNGYIQTKDKTIDGVTNFVNGRDAKPSQYLEVAEKFWKRVVEHHSYVTGGNSNNEHFQADDSQWAIRSNINCETCNTYNMLKLSRMLFSLTKDKKYLDYYENTYINAILSSQNPETGMTMYFQPMAPGYFKVYSSETNHFWCCTGSGMESMSKLGDSIYYDAGNATYVAMYMSSTYKTDNVSLTMAADLENSDKVTIKVNAGKTILRLRRPDWTTKFEVKLDGKALEVSGSEDFVSVQVSKGSEVELTLGKQITVHTLPGASGVYAFKYGPYVLSAELGTKETDQNANTESHGVQVKKPLATTGIVTSYQTTNDSLPDLRNNINTYMTRGSDGKFTLTGVNGGPLTYSIHYKQYTQRYAIYLTFLGQDTEPEQPAEPSIESTEIENVIQPGRGQYEGGGFLENESGSTSGEGYRSAKAGESFSYWVGVDKTDADANYIVTSLAKADNGKTLKLSSGNTVFYEKTLGYTGDNDFYDVYIPIPASIVSGAQRKTLGGTGSETTKDRILVKIESGKTGEASAALHTYFKTVKIEGGARDESIAYFVDCGDYDPSTLSSGDKFGMMNSVTEQAYGADPLTGRMWGVWDEATESTWEGSAPIPGSVSTNTTWAYEFATGDGVAKTETNRYTKNQNENSIPRNLHYKFELPNGNYTVKMYFANPWNNALSPNVSANGASAITNGAVNQELTFSVSVTGGTLTLDITSNSLCINLAYIIIAFA